MICANKYILNFAPTGMIPTKQMTPYVPIRPDEIIRDVLEAASHGANMVHLHARDLLSGLPTYRKSVYAEIINGIRTTNKDIILCVSTSGRNFHKFEERSECLDLTGQLKPDFGSLTLSSLNFNKQASINSPEMIKMLAEKMKQNNIKPELEVFDLGMINFAKYLIRKQLIDPPFYFNLILGNIACAQANMMHLGLMINELPAGAIWSVGAVGTSQLKMNVLSIASGGGVRIGLEDNIWYDHQRTTYATNESLVKRIVSLAAALGFQPYTTEETRELLGLSSGI